MSSEECQYKTKCPSYDVSFCENHSDRYGIRSLIGLDKTVDETISDLELTEEDIEHIRNDMRYNEEYLVTIGTGKNHFNRFFREEAFFYMDR